MQKLITSFLISIALTLSLGEIVKNRFQEKWFMTLSYEHIGRQLDLNYMLLNNIIADRTEENFKYLVANLNAEIISKKTPNACSSVRGLQDNPNILIKFIQLNLEISMVSSEKSMLEKCEKFLDDKINKFNLLNKKVLTTMLKNPNNPLIYKKKNIDELSKILREIIKQFEADGLEAFIENQNDAESKIKYATLMINFINSIADTTRVTDESIYDIEFVKKTFSELRKKDENILLMYFGLFIIIQTIMLTFFFVDKRLIIKLKNKSKNLLRF